MRRFGRHARPFYRISVMHSSASRDAEAIEDIGTYNPMLKDKSQRATLNMERYDYWLSVGAKPSDRLGTMVDKIKNNRWGAPKPPPAALQPKIKEKAPVAEEGAEGAEAPAEEASA
jgi:small subunit ribosomal protein S16